MMSKKQLACMLALHIVYLLVGASIFYHIESPLELAQRAEEKLERLEIQNLLYENYIPNDPHKQDSILRKLSDYCGKSMYNFTTEDEEPPYKWDFYHSFFFSYTVVSTIGYGNLAPTTHLSRILMIFYGLFGIPINGILLANLGEYFGLQLISVYRKYKKRNEKRADKLDYFFMNLGMLGQIFLYLVPGFLFFIFLPACIFVVFEGWDFVAGVYYAFVTLTTIGFGDLVAGTVNNGFKYGYFLTYQIFLIIWITFGLGYIVMLLGFITSGMRSERVHRLEQKFACQLKTTQSKILQGFTRDIAIIRKIINEANLIKLKPVYVESKPHIHRSVSCPILTYDVEPRGPIIKRKRANSENIYLTAKDMLRIQSDTDLLGIDKEKTFTASAIVKPAELLARVVNVLGGFNQVQENRGINIFDDEQILASEKPPLFSIGNDILNSKRTRALSVAVPNYRKESVSKFNHDFTWTNGDTAEKYRKEANIRSGKLSLPTAIQPPEDMQPKSLFARLFRKPSSGESPTEYIKNTMRGRVSAAQASTDNSKDNQKSSNIFPLSYGLSDEERNDLDKYKEKTKRGRHSIFPTFDFSEDEDTATRTSYQQRPKRHSIFPTFNFSEDENEEANRYKEKTRRGRHSIFPSFDFSEHTSNDEDTMDEDEIERYQNRTRRGRTSLFPSFGKSKKNDEEHLPESSDELVNYKEKTKHGRSSLFPSFGKSRKISSPEECSSDLESSIRQYQNQTKRGRKSCFAGDASSYMGNQFASDLENYRNRTKRGRPSLFDPDVNISTLPENEQVEVLENTSVADLLRALAVLETANTQSTIESGDPRRRGSLRPDYNLSTISNRDFEEQVGPRRRRVSARLAAPQFTPTLATVVAGAELQITAATQRENRMTMLTHPPPPYSETEDYQPRARRYSPAPSESRSGPIPRMYSRSRKESHEEPSRRGSLTDIVIDTNKDKT
ncbi:open rectifier potassium channel protein 1 [Zerene cesonia]|uniref:open rectifier potassium channel protein 1 n=1 Tax=Zerene cesonia TaxID=33412 RepID=UPI0018E51786|nr:open rectifier potassium channel protein 1 [Zerene cesonia]